MATMINRPKTHLTRKEAAEYLSVSDYTLAKWVTLGKGPKFTKLGTAHSARVRYALSDLDAFLRGEAA